MSTESNIEDVQAPINTAPPEVKQIIERVCRLEKSRLARKSKGAINDDILGIIKEAVKEVVQE
ncbi:MAG: hypothetical protein ACKO9I_05135 [Sphaerospermopsis kisseleviana]|jgi:hypothetical protein|uniref:Uncharacterized protein n=3 Tax=Sphaerospermopsis TaxID=752201 RepID=A0A480AAG3_9CYAN|nr:MULTISPECIES: hypothetical protein [Sphaerospermopsis]MEB3147880.1 hypothetical protein [Sphaerospermopsis sp.]BAZ80544.1 hypothetical protein NIES73_18050 [Sphaerospermopsis kisseleviana NIES-73]MBC5797869.1 hypothetical protein [Sphaerospermopsis sp. LEGE 00249]MBD2134782.1 hypothetical protein [Sphaerospermopsis sp. FACHB-1094]MBD2147336.1 hypothetical protein [Sphaerospermopsis sp. FACHB-1194]